MSKSASRNRTRSTSDEVKAVLPYGNGDVNVVAGGLDVPKPDGSGVTILANAAVVISFDMERKVS